MKHTIITFEECFNMFSLLAEWLVLIQEFESKKVVNFFNLESFLINFALSSTKETDFSSNKGLLRY